MRAHARRYSARFAARHAARDISPLINRRRIVSFLVLREYNYRMIDVSKQVGSSYLKYPAEPHILIAIYIYTNCARAMAYRAACSDFINRHGDFHRRCSSHSVHVRTKLPR